MRVEPPRGLPLPPSAGEVGEESPTRGIAVSIRDLISIVLGMRRKLGTRRMSSSLPVRDRIRPSLPVHERLRGRVAPLAPPVAAATPLSCASCVLQNPSSCRGVVRCEA